MVSRDAGRSSGELVQLGQVLPGEPDLTGSEALFEMAALQAPARFMKIGLVMAAIGPHIRSGPIGLP
jgi:hypothetical protein